MSAKKFYSSVAAGSGSSISTLETFSMISSGGFSRRSSGWGWGTS